MDAPTGVGADHPWDCPDRGQHRVGRGGRGAARRRGLDEVSAKEAREIIGTRDALTLADELAARGVVPDEAVIRELHRRVLWSQSQLLTPGEYRRGENRVVDADGDPIFGTPPSGDVPELMRDFAAWLATATKRHAPPSSRPSPTSSSSPSIRSTTATGGPHVRSRG